MKNKDHIVFFNINSKIQRLLTEAIQQGLKEVRSFLDVCTPLEMLVFYNPYQMEKSFWTDGSSWGKQTMSINVNIKKSFSPARLREFASTIVHEYVHCIRHGKKIQTLLDAIINEGVSCTTQTELYGPPIYLDFKNTSTDDIQKLWKLWHKTYLMKSIDANSSTHFLDYRNTREGGYQLGFYIVTNYADAKKLSPQKLWTCSINEIKKFALTLFQKNTKNL